MSIGARIREARKAAGMSQDRLAEEVKVLRGIPSLTAGAIWQWESESGTAPTMENLAATAVVLGVNLEWLGTGRGSVWYTEAPEEMAVQAGGVSEPPSLYSQMLSSSDASELAALVKKLKPRQRKALANFIKEFVVVK